MKELKLTKYVQTNATVLDNEFIDHYMVRANGEYVKVYLLLLRHMNQSSGYLSVSELADRPLSLFHLPGISAYQERRSYGC